MDEDFSIADESGDRKYFTIIPNYILNHSTLYDREVYIQMKRIAGDAGKCWASRTTLANQCGMSVRRLDQSIKYLLEHDWIRRVGTRKISTGEGGIQKVYEYQVVNLWKKNIEFYEKKGSAGDALPVSEGGAGGALWGAQEVHQGSAGGAHKEEPLSKEEPKPNKREASISYVENLDREEIQRLSAKYVINEGDIRTVASRLVLYCGSKGRRYKNYKLTLEAWISRDFKLRDTSNSKYAKYS